MLYQISNDIQLATRPEGHSDAPSTEERFTKRLIPPNRGLAARPILNAIINQRVLEREREAQRLKYEAQRLEHEAQLLAEELQRHQNNGSQFCIQLSSQLRMLAYPLFAARLSDALSSAACKAFARGFMLSLGEPKRKLIKRTEER